MTWVGMCGSGAVTGIVMMTGIVMIITLTFLMIIHRDQRADPAVSFAAVAGSSNRVTFVSLTVAAARRRTGATSLASASPGRLSFWILTF